jgi:hypothetical protein
MTKRQTLTCECGYPRAVGFACTACARYDHLPQYHQEEIMSYSDKNPAFDRMHKTAHDARIQWEAQRAAELIQQNPSMSRDEALKRAAAEYSQR